MRKRIIWCVVGFAMGAIGILGGIIVISAWQLVKGLRNRNKIAAAPLDQTAHCNQPQPPMPTQGWPPPQQQPSQGWSLT
jgi:hypothetical protein